jgi:hypothetical protein
MPAPARGYRKTSWEPITPLPRSAAVAAKVSWTNISIWAKPKPAPEDDLFGDDPPDERTPDEEDTAPIPRIERDTKLEEEIEQEKYVPIEELIADIHEVGQTLDPVRMYLRDIGRHPLLQRRRRVGAGAGASRWTASKRNWSC